MNLIKIIAKPFYSADFYQLAYQNKQGLGLFYILRASVVFPLLLATIWAFVIYFQMDTNFLSKRITNPLFEKGLLEFDKGFNRILGVASSFPEIKIIDNKLQMDNNQSKAIYDPVTSKKLIVYNPEGEIKNFKDENAKIGFSKLGIFACADIKCKSHEFTTYEESFQKSLFKEKQVNVYLNILSQFPLITYQNKILTYNEVDPYFIINKSSNKKLVKIDLQVQDHNFNDAEESYLYITNNMMSFNVPYVIKKVSFDLNEANYKNFDQFLFNIFEELKSFLLFEVTILIFITIFLFLFFVSVVCSTVFSLLTLIFIKVFNVDYKSYKDVIRLTVYSLSPVLTALVFAASLIIGNLIYLVLFAFIFTLIAVLSNKLAVDDKKD